MLALRYTIAICMYSVILGSAKPDDEEVDYCAEPNWFKCSNSRCLSNWFVCDGEDDCGDNSDEINCADSLKKCTDFRCENGSCVKSRRVCDGFHDCADLSDEVNCGDRIVPPEQCNNQINRFLCDNGRCIALNETCNDEDDCGDNSDENERECQNSEELCKTKNICSHHCNKTPRGSACSCPRGYSLVNNATCQDINECIEEAKLCDQRCVNEAGSYYCTCGLGYELQDDGSTCKAEGGEALMIFSMDNGIRGLYLDSKINFAIIENLPRPVAITMDANYVYWSNVQIGNKSIMRRREDGDSEIFAIAGVGLPEQLALDWLTGNLYFIDSFWKHIAVCKNDASYCTTILCDTIISSPTGLVLNPSNGELFWSECGSVPRISRASMNGQDVETLLTEDLGCPTDLAIDHHDERLYFVDTKRESVESISLHDVNDRRRVLQWTGQKLHSIAIFEMKLYWCDRRGRSIESADIRNVSDRSILVEGTHVGGIHIYHPVLQQTVRNPCENNSCSQLCLLARNFTYSCACKTNDSLNTDGHTCSSVKEPGHLTIASGRTLLNYWHEALGKPRINASSGSRFLKHVAYDSKAKSLIANDEFTDQLIRLDQPDDELIGSTSSQHLNGMDYDNCANIYSSNGALRIIEIQSVHTGGKIFMEFLHEPKDILLVPKYAIMFVVFEHDGFYRVDELRMTRTLNQPNRIVEELRGPKISLAWDTLTERLFFADEATGVIESCSRNGEDRRLVRSGLRGLVSLAVMDRRIFWTLRNSRKLQWIDLRDRYHGVKEVLLPVPNEDYVEIMDLVNVGEAEDHYEHPCRRNNGGCSHVCLVTLADDRSRLPSIGTCDCPIGMILDEDNRTCIFRDSGDFGGTGECSRCAFC